MRPLITSIERSFPLIILLGAAVGMAVPEGFVGLRPYIPVLLGVVMFGMGLTITADQLRESVLQPMVVPLAMLKFLLMPLFALALAVLLRLPPEAQVGMVILGACPGGTSANIMSYLARADTALAVTLTIVTTLLSPLLTPLIIYLLCHADVALDVVGMMHKLFWVVLFPLLDAILLRRWLGPRAAKLAWAFPPLSMLAIVLIIAFVAAVNRDTLLAHPLAITAAVLLFNLGGYGIGYAVSGVLGLAREGRRAVAFEFGIQDSALGVIIATGFFPGLAALPSALASVIQNVSGPWVARWFARR